MSWTWLLAAARQSAVLSGSGVFLSGSAVAAVLLVALCLSPPVLAAPTIRVSVASDGAQSNGASFCPAISGDGRYVAFPSCASSLVAADSNDTWEVFLRERAICDFSGSPTRGHAGVMVDFTDLSTAEPTGWDWDFGDGDAPAFA